MCGKKRRIAERIKVEEKSEEASRVQPPAVAMGSKGRHELNHGLTWGTDGRPPNRYAQRDAATAIKLSKETRPKQSFLDHNNERKDTRK